MGPAVLRCDKTMENLKNEKHKLADKSSGKPSPFISESGLFFFVTWKPQGAHLESNLSWVCLL